MAFNKIFVFAGLVSMTFGFITKERYDQINKESKFEVLPFETVAKLFPSFQGQIRTQKLEFLDNDSKPEKPVTPVLKDNVNKYTAHDIRDSYPQCLDNIKWQQGCGGCWAFSAVNAFEARNCIANQLSANVPLSVQHLLSCDTGNNGCNAGSVLKAWNFFETEGLYPAYCLPYVSQRGSLPRCPRKSDKNALVNTCDLAKSHPTAKAHKIKAVLGEKPESVLDQVKHEIKIFGPVSATINTYDDFYTYKRGIYTHGASAVQISKHAVIFIGYGRENVSQTAEAQYREYFIGINSWGTQWGDKGTFRVYADDTDLDVLGNIVVGYSKWTENAPVTKDENEI